MSVAPTQQPNRTLRTIDALVRSIMLPLARHGGRRRPAGHIERTLTCRVERRDAVADGVVALTLVRDDGADLPAWLPGAHVDVVLPDGLRRQYSLNGDPADRGRYRIAVRRIRLEDGGAGGSLAMHALRVGDRIGLQGPRQAFPLIDAPGYLFVAGGIGITPILPMLAAVDRAGRPWRLQYAGRSRASMPFLDEIAGLDAGRGRAALRADDEHGPPAPDRLLDAAPPDAAVYACGPPPLVEALRSRLPLPAIAGLHSERFSSPPVRGGRAFAVRLGRDGERVAVGAEESALAAVRRVRPAQAHSCRQGFCGTCRVGVLAPPGTASMLLCVDRPEHDDEVVLDL